MPFTIDKDRKKMFTVEPLPLEDIPDNLKAILSKTPDISPQYLKILVDNGKITTDDVIFLIDSGALQN